MTESKPKGGKMGAGQDERLVLAIDDDPHVLRALERVLRRGGYNVITAEGGEQALKALDGHPELALVISDYWMPGVSGADVLKAARVKLPDAARIAITGDAHANTILECLNTGLASHMQMKPWDDPALLQTVREALSLRDLRLEHRQLKQQAAQQDAAPSPKASAEAAPTQKAAPTQEAVQRLEDTIQDLVALLAFLMDLQSSGQRGHSKRVAQLSSWLAQVKGLPTEEVRQIEIAALLKDLGEVAAPPQPTDAAPGDEPLPDAVQQMVGVQLLKRIAGFEQIADMVSGLHGTGGTGEEGATLGSEILAVADTYDSQMFPSGEGVVQRPSAAEYSLIEMRDGELNAELVDTFREQVIPGYVASEESEIEVSIDQLQPGMVIARDVINVHSIPLLYAGTTLAEADIVSLKRNEQFNAVFSGIFVKVGSLPKAADEPAEPPPPPKAASPAHAVSQSGTTDEVANGKPAPKKTKHVIVVIDDEKSVVAALRRELRSSGYQVKGFTDPAEGLKYIRGGGSAHVVISDYMMPGIKGDRLLVEIQDIRPELPCIIITGHATKDTVAHLAKSAKPVRMLAKPWDKAQLLETLRGFGQKQ